MLHKYLVVDSRKLELLGYDEHWSRCAYQKKFDTCRLSFHRLLCHISPILVASLSDEKR